MRVMLLFLVSGLFGACAGDANQTTGETQTSVPPAANAEQVAIPDSMLQGCYSFIYGRDTASLELGIEKGNVTGSLSYNFYRKDRNDGSFEGEVNGDILRAWYLFRSEGKMSVREQVWKIRPGQLWPATGGLLVRNDTVMFSDRNRLSFDSNRVFVKVNCII